MNLVIDIGNTRVKAALFNNDELVEIKWFSSPAEVLNDLTFIERANRAIIGSVIDETEQFLKKLNEIMPACLFTSQTKIPLKNLYQSVSTLGSDRLAASIGAFAFFPNSNTLVIDAGTCIKYNFTNASNKYLGGGISPGLNMRFRALHEFTGKLPLIKMDTEYEGLIGTTTQNSILSGVITGSIAEIDGIISLYRAQYSGVICVLTGGDSEHLAKQLKSSIFTRQNLVLQGLNYILNDVNT